MSESNQGHHRESDLAVMGANEYKQKRRLQRILDAHDRVEEQANEAYELYVSGRINDDGKNIKILRAVQQFIREVHNLLMDYSETLEEDQTNIYWEGRNDNPIGVLEMSHAEDVVFHGLRDVMYANDFYLEEWQEKIQARHEADKTVTHTQEHSVPESVSWNAYILTKMFLSDQHDLEIQFEDINNKRPLSDWSDDNE